MNRDSARLDSPQLRKDFLDPFSEILLGYAAIARLIELQATTEISTAEAQTHQEHDDWTFIAVGAIQCWRKLQNHLPTEQAPEEPVDDWPAGERLLR